MKRRQFLGAAGATAAAYTAAPVLAQRGPAPVREWEIGPVIRGRNYSQGMPLHPTGDRDQWYFDFPGPRRSDGHVHYLTTRTGSLQGARGMRLRYRIDARPGARFVPQETPDQRASLSLFLQTAGDDWSGRRGQEFSRWYSPRQRPFMLRPGEFEAEVMFDEDWISVMGQPRRNAPREFERALANAERIGFTFGSRTRRGHGVFATAPARFTMLEFGVFG